MKTALWLGFFCMILAVCLWFLLQSKQASVREPEPESAQVTEGETIPLYYYKQENDLDALGNPLCTRKGLVAVSRKLPAGHSLNDRIELLLRGELTSAEKAQGITTEYPLAGVKLTKVTIENRKALLTFEDVLSKTRGGACRSAILWYQIEKTALAFGDIRDVEFRPEELFQP